MKLCPLSRLSIRLRLTFMFSLIIIGLAIISSTVFIFYSINEINQSLITRGITLIRSLSIVSANSIAGYQYSDVEKGISDTVLNDKEIVYGYLENLDFVPIVFQDEIITIHDEIISNYKNIDKIKTVINPASYGI